MNKEKLIKFISKQKTANADRAIQTLSAFFYARKFSNSSIKQNSPNVLFTVKKFKLLRLGAPSDLISEFFVASSSEKEYRLRSVLEVKGYIKPIVVQIN